MTAAADGWFDAQPEAQREVLLALRQVIRGAVPEAVEEIKWSRPCYSAGGTVFCYLQGSRAHVTLGFTKGATLPDPAGILEGTGKEMRHVRFGKGRNPGDPAILALLSTASKG
jgi:hypothetical protein